MHILLFIKHLQTFEKVVHVSLYLFIYYLVYSHEDFLSEVIMPQTHQDQRLTVLELLLY